MKWPWTSSARLDDLREAGAARVGDLEREIDYLRDQNTALTDALTRIQRVNSGMGEVPRPERVQMEPMPRTLRDAIDGFMGEGTRKMMRDELYRRKLAGASWEALEAGFRTENLPEDT